MAKLNTADIGFEDQIWKAADKMRGNLDASEYKSVVLGLIFLKYISDKFEAGKIDTTPLITHRYKLADIAEAYHLFENKLDGVIKVAVEP